MEVKLACRIAFPKLLHVAALAGITEEVKAALDLEEPLEHRGGDYTSEQGQATLSDKEAKPYGTSESYLRRRLARDHPVYFPG